MRPTRHLVGIAALFAALAFVFPPTTTGQEIHTTLENISEVHEQAEHEFHRNHFGGFMGASTHSDNNETGFTLGLEYARQFSPRWAIVAYTELASGTLERDVVLAMGGILYPMRRLGLVVAPGVEFVSKDVEHHGELKKEEETEFLLRLGVGYGFPVGQAGLGPSVFIDWSADRWTFIYGIGMVTGF